MPHVNDEQVSRGLAVIDREGEMVPAVVVEKVKSVNEQMLRILGRTVLAKNVGTSGSGEYRCYGPGAV